MARQQYDSQPWRKHFEVYNNFSGGLNTMDANETLRDTELTTLTNVDLGERGTLKRRTGYTKIANSPDPTKKIQGYFRYYGKNATDIELIMQDGKLYRNVSSWSQKEWALVPIEGLTGTIQSDKMVEGVQTEGGLYIATGTKLIVFDGSVGTAKVVSPYYPKPLEALYIGTNGLFDDPDAYLTNGVSAFLQIEGVNPDKRYGIVGNKNATTFRVFSSHPVGETPEFKFERKHEKWTDWHVSQDWNTSQTWTTAFPETGDYQIRVSARLQSAPSDVEEFYLPKYTVYETDRNEVPDYSKIHTCRRILLHWGRLYLYGGDDIDLVYISHLNNPRYFPTTNTLRFENEWSERITNIIPYRNMLVVFSPHTIQGLFGKSPGDFQRVMMNSAIGCVTERTARVIQNHIIFHSHDGFYILKSVGITDERINVEKIDTKIHDLVPKNPKIVGCSVVYNNQYIAYFPEYKKAFRYYYEFGVWVTDESDILDIKETFDFDGELCIVREYGDILNKSATSYIDDTVPYELKIETKFYTFGQPHHLKKLKEIQLILGNGEVATNAELAVFADSQIILDPTEGKAVITEEGFVEWQVLTTPNLKANPGTIFGSWLMGESPWGNVDAEVHKLKLGGKCRRTKVIITHKEDASFQLIGLAYIFKIKKP